MTEKEKILKEILLYEQTLKDPLFKNSHHIVKQWLTDAKARLMKYNRIDKRKIKK